MVVDDENLASGGDHSAGEPIGRGRVAIPPSAIRPLTSVHTARNFETAVGIQLTRIISSYKTATVNISRINDIDSAG